MVRLDEAVKAALTREAPLTAKAMWGYIALIEAYRAAYAELASLPVGHSERAGTTQRQFKVLMKRFDALLRACRNTLRYLDD